MSTLIQFPGDTEQALSEIVSGEVGALMGRYKVSQTELARWLGFTQPALSARLRGATRWTLEDVGKIAAAFSRHPAEILGGRVDGRGPDPDGGIPIILVRHQGLEPRTRWFEGFVADLQGWPDGDLVAAA